MKNELVSVFRLKFDFKLEFLVAIARKTVMRYLRSAWKIVKSITLLA